VDIRFSSLFQGGIRMKKKRKEALTSSRKRFIVPAVGWRSRLTRGTEWRGGEIPRPYGGVFEA
jgi:hypothetical protein